MRRVWLLCLILCLLSPTARAEEEAVEQARQSLVRLYGLGTDSATGQRSRWTGTGFAVGVGGPSRDMMIKKATPKGATGRVYGTVYSGLDLGFCLAAPVFGALLDRGMTSGIFYGSAITLALSVVSAALVGVGVAARLRRAAAVAA